MSQPIVIGAVAYSERVVPIWEGMRDYFREAGPAIDFVLFSNYDRQVEALLARHIDIAWNTNLAWAKTHHRTNGTCRALALRDADVGFNTVFVARTDSGIESLEQLRDKRLGLGSADSVQAAILPFHYLQEIGIQPDRDCTLHRFNRDLGKHGDTGGSELDVLHALEEGRVDAGALSRPAWERHVAANASRATRLAVVWSSPGYCHCNFTALAAFPKDRADQWVHSLTAMRYEDPRWRPLMDLEGLRRWVAAEPSTLEGYRVVLEAAQRQGLLDLPADRNR